MDCESLRHRLEQRLTSALHTAEQIKIALSLIDAEVTADLATLPEPERCIDTSVVSERTTRYVKGTPRPDGIPSNDVMFARVLASAQKNGIEGLVSGEIVRAVRDTYWPGVTNYQLLPALYSAAKSGKLTKSADGKFRPGRRNKEAVGHSGRMSNGLM